MSEDSLAADYTIEPLRQLVVDLLGDVVAQSPAKFAVREVKPVRAGEFSYSLERTGDDELGLLLTVSRRYHPSGEVVQRRTIGGKPRFSSFEAIWGRSCTAERLSRWVRELEDAEAPAWGRG